MIIDVDKWLIDDNIIYKVTKLEKCCEEILKNKSIDLVNETYGEDNNAYYVALITEEESYYPEDPLEDIYTKIDYCPFCGKPIEIHFNNVITDKSEEYNELAKQKDVLWKKYNKTDSKKKSQKLYEQVNELDKQKNKIYRDSNFSDFRKEDEE